MKLKMTFLAASMAMLSSFANAADVDAGHGTVNFNGTIIQAPCSISPESANIDVSFGQVASAVLNNGGKSLTRDINIVLEQCDATAFGKEGTVDVTFNGANDADLAKNLAIVGASGASIGIADSQNKDIPLGTASTVTLDKNSQTQKLAFKAYLQGNKADGTVTTGEFTSVATFQLAYN